MDKAALAWTRRMVASRRSRVWVRDVLRLRSEARRRWALWGVKSSVDGVGGISAEREAEYTLIHPSHMMKVMLLLHSILRNIPTVGDARLFLW